MRISGNEDLDIKYRSAARDLSAPVDRCRSICSNRIRSEAKLKLALVLTAALWMNLPWLAYAQGPPGPYPGPQPGPEYPAPGYPPPGYPPLGYAEAHWAQCQQMAQAEHEI